MPAYLTGTFRSRSFSLPQRFDPPGASWLCFAPLPSIGFRPSELFPRDQPWHLSMPAALMPLEHIAHHRADPDPSDGSRLQSLHPVERPTPDPAGLAPNGPLLS
jgi:hypothetical protein